MNARLFRVQPQLQAICLGAGLLFASGCDESTSSYGDPCDVLLEELQPDSALPGATVYARGTPFTSLYDTAIYVGSTRADLTEVTRSHCDSCDSCREENSCVLCSDCDACDDICATCWEVAGFEVPNLSAGTWPVRLYNRHGESDSLDLTIPGGDTAADTSPPPETGDSHTGEDTNITPHTGDTGGSVHTGDTSGSPHTGDTSALPGDTSAR